MSLWKTLSNIVEDIGDGIEEAAVGIGRRIGTVLEDAGQTRKIPDSTVQVTESLGVRRCSTCENLRYLDKIIKFTLYRLYDSGQAGCTCCWLLYSGISALLKNTANSLEPVELNTRYYEKSILLMFPDRATIYPPVVWKIEFTFPDNLLLPITAFTMQKHPTDYSHSESSNHVLRLAKKCNDEHRCVKDWRPKLPKRVIDVGNAGNGVLRLCCSDGDQRNQYTILSHCWGGSSPLITRADSLEERKRGVPLNALPKTFRDAVAVTRLLGIRYLWIDSLCILQEDRQDWEIEAPKMADYYSNAYITIAASRAENCETGFLLPIENRRVATVQCESDQSRFDVIVQESHNTAATSELENKLYTRAWVFQEMTVAPRVISYGAKELEWYCREHNWCECSYLVPESYDKSVHSGHWQKCREQYMNRDYQDWLDMVTEFTRRNLTQRGDRLPAISALAKQFSSNLNAPYMAGIWNLEPMIWSGLRWRPWTVGTYLAGTEAPSWSWASVECLNGVVYGHPIPSDGIEYRDTGVKLLKWETYLKSTSLFGEVSGGILRVIGPLLHVKLEIKPNPESNWRRNTTYRFSMLSTGRAKLKGVDHTIEKCRTNQYQELIDFRPDTPLELHLIRSSSQRGQWTFKRSSDLPNEHPKAIFGEVYCLRFIDHTIYDPDELGICMLVLGCLDARMQTYQRIGLAYFKMVEQNIPFFREVDSQTLTIV
ncbi:heterokaryon incompatibility protein-domain-containing protein [Bisporella sp. PMI_857]|nr:heterokaryon incompatibility protein-domain-containing protein [Bisporella sp. PMI_857]